MSRIHDALKRAEEERAAQNPRSGVVPPTTISPEHGKDGNHLQAISIETHRTPEAVRTARRTDESSLQFDELVKRCSHPEWKADSSFRVSLTSDMGKIV